MNRKLALTGAAVAVTAVWASFSGTSTPPAGAAVNVASRTATGLNTVVADAIDRAVAATPPECRMRWQVIAGFGEVESNNARDRGISSNGDIEPLIIGPRLDGVEFALIEDTDGGLWDGDVVYDRAVGPWQSIPSTWAGGMARDGNGDGVMNPHNLYDSTAGAAAKLCHDAGGPIDIEANFVRAAWSYNQSVEYREKVRAEIARFDAMSPAPMATAGGVRQALGDAMLAEPAATIWDQLVVAAKADDVVLVASSSWRSPEEQAELRWRNKCPDLTSPSSTCETPTAPLTPEGENTSMHGQGLAVDVADLPGAWRWMAANAPRYGFYGLVPGEPWHYSVTGH